MRIIDFGLGENILNYYYFSSLVALILFGMGLLAIILGIINYLENTKSKKGKQMLWVCICVFFWDFGYAWMSLCYDSDFAYVPRAIALSAVSLYMFFILRYAALVVDYPMKKLWLFLGLFLAASITSWFFVIQKDAVEFVMTPWGYWYTSRMSKARLLQAAANIFALAKYYVILDYGKKRTKLARQKYVLRQFSHIGIILFLGYMFDTLLPIMFHIPAIPGSSIGAFVSSMILFLISRNNKTFGLSKANVSEYVFRDVQIPIVITNPDGNIVLYNDYTENYLKYKEEDLLHHPLRDFFCESENDIVTVKEIGCMCILDRTDIKDQFDDLQYSIYFMTDVTKEIETQRMLEESREAAEEANKAKSNFLANMSHEIRTPMNAIIGMSNIVLQEKNVSEKVRSQINEISIAGNNLLGIINDILDISKIEAGKYELVEDNYELPSLLNDVGNVISVRVQETNARFIMEIDKTLPKLLIGDAVRVRQILLNILGNAAKFTKRGSITLVATWNHDESEPIISFDVKDTGIGIKPEHMESIFGEFNQVDTRKNRNIQGTGLGLAISKHLAELMGGTITVDSVYGQGSTFYIQIVQKVKNYQAIGEEIAEALQNRQYNSVTNRKQIEITPRPEAKVLIVDDVKVNLMVAKGMMKKYGMQIDLAMSGKEAIEMVQKKDYDIIFMDHMMPEMDGIDTTKNIRALGEQYQKLVIVALTANAVGEAKQMFLEQGLQDFLAKPIEVKELDEVLNRWLPV